MRPLALKTGTFPALAVAASPAMSSTEAPAVVLATIEATSAAIAVVTTRLANPRNFCSIVSPTAHGPLLYHRMLHPQLLGL
mmetsp:Transcript_16280/g.33305  ORF Transcript_16280/g.33305 Transcript_16280/m.33305 type:complete len:81 (-) Transcript_16280:14-256(-)